MPGLGNKLKLLINLVAVDGVTWIAVDETKRLSALTVDLKLPEYWDDLC